MKRMLLLAVLVVGLAGLGVIGGSVHVVRGGKVRIWPGVTVCPKKELTFRNTFLNTDDYVDQPKRVAELDDAVILALCDCGLCYVSPEAWPEDPGVM